MERAGTKTTTIINLSAPPSLLPFELSVFVSAVRPSLELSKRDFGSADRKCENDFTSWRSCPRERRRGRGGEAMIFILAKRSRFSSPTPCEASGYVRSLTPTPTRIRRNRKRFQLPNCLSVKIVTTQSRKWKTSSFGRVEAFAFGRSKPKAPSATLFKLMKGFAIVFRFSFG